MLLYCHLHQNKYYFWQSAYVRLIERKAKKNLDKQFNFSIKSFNLKK